MKMTVEMLDEGIKKIDLSGRMDIEGTSQVEMKLTLVSAVEKSFVVIDLSQVDYMASIGIGTLVSTAKFIKLRGGKLVLLNPQPNVALVLAKTGINAVIPIYHNFEDAKKALLEAQ
jgi:anti-sigma B factor antagonist